MKRPNVHCTPTVDETRANLGVAVLAGGASKRFGADKALVRLCPDGPTLIEAVVTTCTQLTSDIVVIGHERYAPLLPGIPIIPDEHPGQGPLAAIANALRSSGTDRQLVVACDMPCLSLPLLHWLAQRSVAAELTVCRTPDGWRQPMPAVYARTLLPAIDSALLGGHRAVASIFDMVHVLELPADEVRQLDPSFDSFFSLNTIDQLARARACASCN